MRKLLVIVVTLASTGLGATEAQACFFKHCRHRRQAACPPGYASLPSAQSPPRTTVAPAQAIDPVTFLLGVVTQQQTFQINQGGVIQNVRVQITPAQ